MSNKKQMKLIQCCKYRTSNVESVRRILGYKETDINAKDDIGWTALMYACSLSRTDIVKELLKMPSIDYNAKNDFGYTALIVACSSWENTEIIKELLKMPSIDYNAKTVHGDTALIYACMREKVEVVRELLKMPSIDYKTNTASTIVFCAFRNIEIVKILQEYIYNDIFSGILPKDIIRHIATKL
jgi:ankyrin repeat protein